MTTCHVARKSRAYVNRVCAALPTRTVRQDGGRCPRSVVDGQRSAVTGQCSFFFDKIVTPTFVAHGYGDALVSAKTLRHPTSLVWTLVCERKARSLVLCLAVGCVLTV